jgi:hypothetical protein
MSCGQKRKCFVRKEIFTKSQSMKKTSNFTMEKCGSYHRNQVIKVTSNGQSEIICTKPDGMRRAHWACHILAKTDNLNQSWGTDKTKLNGVLRDPVPSIIKVVIVKETYRDCFRSKETAITCDSELDPFAKTHMKTNGKIWIKPVN